MNPSDRSLLALVSTRDPWWLLVLVLSGCVAAAAGLLLPDAVARAVDAVLDGGGVTSAVLWFAALAAVEVVADVLDVIARARTTSSGTAWLRHRLSGHLLALGTRRRFASGDAVSRLTTDCAEAGGVSVTVVRLALAALTSLGSVVALALLDWRLAMVFLAGVPVALLLAGTHLRQTADDVAAYQRVSGELSARLLDAMRGVRTIAASGTAEQETARVLRPLPRLAAAGTGMWRAQSRMVWRAALLLPAVELAVLITAGFSLAAGRLSTGQVLGALGYVVLGMSLVRQAPLLTALARARAGAARIAEVLDTPPPRRGAQHPPPGPGRVELRGVGVLPDVLRDVDLVVPAGAFVVVVGASGSGKSALTSVLGGLLEPDTGRVLLDGRPLQETSAGAVFGHAFDRPALLGRTVADAVACGTSADRSRVRAACRAAQVHDVVVRLPEGYDTPLALTPLSGGEAQRLGLARAIVRDPRVLVLDDATASLDAVTESGVSRAIDEALPGRTRVVTTHRVTTAERADLVVWLERGRVRRSGPHEVLWEDPEYRAVFAEARG
ncbi:ABC transporter ATP-binding protein [Umezawaea beigongshangensis]|uniref:ABC transporter ATP-binding protein n=1 Tax=Umezawaea beigongshangensis TaxID=2780383 RepID=UPI0018F1225C|nr:ABC transporter ATP-binding protein [Umezawaea beigongshangensis]